MTVVVCVKKVLITQLLVAESIQNQFHFHCWGTFEKFMQKYLIFLIIWLQTEAKINIMIGHMHILVHKK